MGHISREDHAIIRTLRESNIAQAIAPSEVTDMAGSVVVACGDGEHSDDWFAHLLKTLHGRTRHHLLTLNGGPALLPKHSPVCTHGLNEGGVLMHNLKVGRSLKEVHNTILVGHWPCGAALAAHCTLPEYLQLMLDAKARVKAELHDDSKVFMFMHVSYGSDKKRTYRLDQTALRAWLH